MFNLTIDLLTKYWGKKPDFDSWNPPRDISTFLTEEAELDNCLDEIKHDKINVETRIKNFKPEYTFKAFTDIVESYSHRIGTVEYKLSNLHHLVLNRTLDRESVLIATKATVPIVSNLMKEFNRYEEIEKQLLYIDPLVKRDSEKDMKMASKLYKLAQIFEIMNRKDVVSKIHSCISIVKVSYPLAPNSNPQILGRNYNENEVQYPKVDLTKFNNMFADIREKSFGMLDEFFASEFSQTANLNNTNSMDAF